MYPALASYLAAIGCVVPMNMERPKRFAKELQKLSPRLTLAQCQTATSHVYGHQDWHALQKACSAQSPGAPFDDEMEVEDSMAREDAQTAVIVHEVMGLDPEDDYEAPEDNTPERMTGAEFEAYVRRSDLQSLVRMQKALNRLDKLRCQWFVFEQSPTQSERRPSFSVEDADGQIATQEFMSTLPQRLAQWWRVNVPHQLEVADAIESHPWDKDRATSILGFARYWGTLNVHYAYSIDFMMGLGTAYLFAQQFTQSIMSCIKLDALTALEVKEMRTSFLFEFMNAYPRDDFVAVGPEALAKNGKDTVKVLSNPKSKRGVWKR